jgi:hypothetical protein
VNSDNDRDESDANDLALRRPWIQVPDLFTYIVFTCLALTFLHFAIGC